jgi:hypothetical protein
MRSILGCVMMILGLTYPAVRIPLAFPLDVGADML